MTVGDIHDLGVPVRGVNWVRLHVARGAGGRPCALLTMGQQGDNLFVVQVDVETGACRQFVSQVPKSNYPTCTHLASDGRLYVGAAYAGHLLRFDAAAGRLEDLGAVHPEAATFPCRMDEDAAGRIWIGSYPGADLSCYDPADGTFTHHGRMDEVDMYCYPWVNTDGRVACAIRQTRPHVEVFDPRTGRRRTVGPVTVKGEDSLDLYRAADGRLYVASSRGDFLVDGLEARPLPAAPPRAGDEARLPDGRAVAFAEAAAPEVPGRPWVGEFRRLAVGRAGEAPRHIDLDYDAAGSDIFCLHGGCDHKVYGSSILPLHLFCYDPAAGDATDLGICSKSCGEAYSMANLAGRIYISSYPAARLSVYDPARPWRFGEDEDANPRDLGPIDDLSYRPRSTLAGPLGRVWLASLPDYGRWGGPLAWYDPATGARHSYPNLFGDGSCYTLAWLADEGLLAIGTSIQGGSGTRPRVRQAELLLWDPAEERIVWRGTPDRPVAEFTALLTGGDGRLYGTVRGGEIGDEVFAFDPRTRRFAARAALPAGRALDLGLARDGRGGIVGMTARCLYRLDAASLRTDVLTSLPVGPKAMGPVLDGRVYFGCGPRLLVADLA